MGSYETLATPPSINQMAADGPLALFLDFDGTLVPIAEGPDAITVPDDLPRMLTTLADRLERRVAIVTGRSIDNLTQFLGPMPLHRAGSHGGHVVAPDGDVLLHAEPLPDAVYGALKDFAVDHGVLFERKTHGGALHYRTNPALEHDVKHFAQGLADQHGLMAKAGKCVIEIVRPGVNKGAAVELLMQQSIFVGARPVFVGDDVTDEDGFAACENLGGSGILVGARQQTKARYQFADVGDVHAWLKS